MMEGAEFDAAEGVWLWNYDGNQLYMERDKRIRVKIENEVFIDVGPVKLKPMNQTALTIQENKDSQPQSPFTIMASIQDSGLGLLEWW